jgi:hypothetical protein
MRILAAAIERNCLCTKNFETEPYEAGWASEARWFVHVFSLRRGAQLRLVPQISFDGLFWCDYTGPDQKPVVLAIKAPGLTSVPLTHFGQWSRLRVEITRAGRGPGPVAGFHLQLVLKG